jgi:hypothetical protein
MAQVNTMPYAEKISSLSENPEQLEKIYQEALKVGESASFQAAIEENHTFSPDNLLYAAWFYRLKHTAERAKSFAIAWVWVVPLALANGLLFWILSDDTRFTIEITGPHFTFSNDWLPVVFLFAAPILAAFILIYFTIIGRKSRLTAAVLSIAMVFGGLYVLLTYQQTGSRPFQAQYLTLMAIHLPLLAWAGVGIFLIHEHRDPANRFAFLIKSLEIFIMGGLFAIAGGLFTGITFGLFDALNINMPDAVIRLFAAGGTGLISVVAVAVLYNPTVSPSDQAFTEGLSKLIALLMRFMLPLTLLVLLVYSTFIPFNFRAPFENRDVLIIYNVMLFAVVALLVGATPITKSDLSPRMMRWLRLGISAVATMALLVSVYALAAILYRTSIDRLTPNRLAFIGWNGINILLLILLLIYQYQAKTKEWLQQLYRAYSAGTILYGVWTVVVILAIPWLFGVDQGDIDHLPATIQMLIYEEPAPILLKCATSPHIYLLEDGEKRWINTIDTFEDRGYVWQDVHFITCNSLRSIPDGETIPPNLGLPPQP